MKSLYVNMKEETAQSINALRLELLSNEVVESINKETGEVTKSVKVGAEVAKGQGRFSRCQFSVKIIDTAKIKVSNEELEENDFEVFFEDLSISYIDAKGVVYFRATSYAVEKAV